MGLLLGIETLVKLILEFLQAIFKLLHVVIHPLRYPREIVSKVPLQSVLHLIPVPSNSIGSGVRYLRLHVKGTFVPFIIQPFHCFAQGQHFLPPSIPVLIRGIEPGGQICIEGFQRSSETSMVWSTWSCQ